MANPQVNLVRSVLLALAVAIGAFAADAAAQSSRPRSARPSIVPPVMSYERLKSDLMAPIGDEQAREAATDRLAQLWGGYFQAWERIDGVEIAAARQALASIVGDKPPSAEMLRNRQADALQAVDRVDRGFFDKLAEALPPESRAALARLERARARAIAAHGLAPEAALVVPLRWVDPAPWLAATSGDVPPAAFERYDAAMTSLSVSFSGPRRRFESEFLVRKGSRDEIAAQVPALAGDLLRAARETAGRSIAIVDGLAPDLAPADVARVHIARIEDIYLDTPRPRRPSVLDAMPADETAREAWRAERDRVAVEDAAILRRYEARALETMAPAVLWDRAAYERRREIAAPFRAEREKLFEDAAARLEAIVGVRG